MFAVVRILSNSTQCPLVSIRTEDTATFSLIAKGVEENLVSLSISVQATGREKMLRQDAFRRNKEYVPSEWLQPQAIAVVEIQLLQRGSHSMSHLLKYGCNSRIANERIYDMLMNIGRISASLPKVVRVVFESDVSFEKRNDLTSRGVAAVGNLSLPTLVGLYP